MPDTFGPLLNRYRAGYGLPPLDWHPILQAVAQSHAEDLARREVLSHGSGPNNTDTVANRLEAAGYAWRFAGENVAFGQQDAAQVMAAWHGSDGHRQLMQTDQATVYGIAMARNHIGPYWVLVLAAPL